MSMRKRSARPLPHSFIFFIRKKALIYDAANQYHKSTQIIREYVEKHKGITLIGQTFITKILRAAKMRDEWAKLFAGEFDRHLQIKLDYYRSKPSLAMRLFRRLVGRHEYKESRQVLITHRERLVVSQRESSEPIPITPSKTTVIHEEFHATPQLIQKISLQAADFVFRRLELERIRKGYI